MERISIIRWLTALAVSASLLYAGVAPPRSSTVAAESNEPVPAAVSKERAVENIGRANVFFEENRGQFDAKARYFARGTKGYELFLTDRAAVYVVRERPANAQRERGPEAAREIENLRREAPARAAAVFMSLAGANESIGTNGRAPLEHRTNYFKGEEANWRTAIPNYSEVRMNGVYDGIDAVWHGREAGGVQYDFVVAPNADPNRVEWTVTGADDVTLDADGGLVIATEFGAIRQNKPFTYQESDGVKQEVASGFVLEPKLAANGAKSFSVRFSVGEYDRAKALTIDPSVNLSNLSFSTLLGGGGDDIGYDIAVDGTGSVFVTGSTDSPEFPATAGTYDPSTNGTLDVFVTKLNAAGTNLIYSTFIGGTSDDTGRSIAVDALGNAVITGPTLSTNYPTTVGAFDTTNNGLSDVFVTKLNAAGSGLVFSTFIGGSGTDWGNGIAIDASGAAFITGFTIDDVTDYPTTAGAFDTSINGGTDVFVTKLNAGGTALVYSTFIGGSATEVGNDIAVDSVGNAFITGYAVDGGVDYPTTAGAFDVTHNGNEDAFVTKLSAAGSSLLYSTFIGATNFERGQSIDIDASGRAYITGYTISAFAFPTTTGAFDTTGNGDMDGFVTKFSATGSTLIYSTYLGGTGEDRGLGITTDNSGNAFVVGFTNAPTDFPTTTGSFDTTHNGGNDVFVTKINPAGSSLGYSTLIGGNANDQANGVTVDSSGNTFVVGQTLGGTSVFPTSPEAFQRQHISGIDSFVSKLGDYSISGRSLDQTGNPLANVAVQMSGLQSGFMLTDAQGYFGFSDTATSGTTWVSGTSSLYNFTPNTYELFPGGNYILQFVGRPVTSGPTIAYGPVGGAVTSTAGNIGLPFASLSIVDVHGTVRTTTTDAVGGYRFDNIRLGEMYVLYAQRDGFNFEPSSAVVNLMTSDLNVNFTARPSVARPVQDFDGDGKTDLAVFRPSEGNWYIEESQTGKLRVVRFGLAGDIPLAGDFDGDRRADIAVFRPSTGDWFRLDSSTGGFFAMHFGMNGDVPVPADFDGDGKADIAVYRPADGVWHRINSTDGSYTAVQWGLSGDKPVTADFDSDGRADPTIFRDGVWYRLNSSNGDFAISRFGLGGDVPSTADFDGDGRPETAVFRPADGTWHWLDSLDGEYHTVQYGLGTDKPIPADYDGDGRLEHAVYRGGIWYKLTSDGRSTASSFGLPTDIPVNRIR